jgi:predicted nucleotidyltransferase
MCSSDSLTQVLSETKNGLAGMFGDRLEDILLYGSYARGTQDDESDIDVMALVRLPQTELARYRRQVSDFSSKLDLKYDVFLSITLQDTESFARYRDILPFYRNVAKEGISYVQ